jgi:DNA-binding XRE family transcriptional regulator
MHRLGIDTVSELAKKLGVSRQSWYKWQRGECSPSEEMVGKMAVLAGFTVKQAKKAS